MRRTAGALLGIGCLILALPFSGAATVGGAGDTTVALPERWAPDLDYSCAAGDLVAVVLRATHKPDGIATRVLQIRPGAAPAATDFPAGIMEIVCSPKGDRLLVEHAARGAKMVSMVDAQGVVIWRRPSSDFPWRFSMTGDALFTWTTPYEAPPDEAYPWFNVFDRNGRFLFKWTFGNRPGVLWGVALPGDGRDAIVGTGSKVMRVRRGADQQWPVWSLDVATGDPFRRLRVVNPRLLQVFDGMGAFTLATTDGRVLYKHARELVDDTNPDAGVRTYVASEGADDDHVILSDEERWAALDVRTGEARFHSIAETVGPGWVAPQVWPNPRASIRGNKLILLGEKGITITTLR